MIKLLCVSEGLCYPPRSGGDHAKMNACKLLEDQVELYILNVTNGYNSADAEAFAAAYPKTRISYVDISRRNRYENIRAAFMRIQQQVMRLFGEAQTVREREGMLGVDLERYAEVYLALNRYIEEHKIDIVQFEFSRPLFWAQGITSPRVKKVFVQHEIQFIVKQQRLAHHPVSAAEQQRILIERNREIQMMNAYDAVITLSQEDKERLEAHGVHAPVFASFAKVQMREALPLDYSQIKNVDLVFVGPEAHEPNRQGLHWFLEEVWGRLHSAFPNLALHIIGLWSDATKENWQSRYENLSFEGFVEDLVEAMQGRLLVVPIFEGSGIRMKILEAANIGVPFVGTTIGAEGLAFTSGKDCYIADDADNFFLRVKELLTDHDRLHVLGQAGYKHAREDFSDARFIAGRMACYRSLVEAPVLSTQS